MIKPFDQFDGNDRNPVTHAGMFDDLLEGIDTPENVYKVGGSNPLTTGLSEKDSFVQGITPAATRAAQKLGTTPEAVMAFAALESGYGKHAPGNNLFGIKSANYQGESNTLNTQEFEDGAMQTRKASFRGYDSQEQSVDDFANFITSNPRYKKALAVAGNPEQFIDEVHKAGYATDPNYASKVKSVMAGFKPSQPQAGMFDDLMEGLEPAQPSEPVNFDDLLEGIEQPEESTGDENGFIANALSGAGERVGDLVGGAFTALESVREALPDIGGVTFDKGIQFHGPGEYNKALEETGAKDLLQGFSDAAKGVDLGYKERAGWDDVKTASKEQGLGAWDEILSYGVETGIKSVPDMFAVMASLPLYIMGRSGEIGEIRAQNKGKEKADLIDVAEAAPFAIGAAILERVGVKGMTSDVVEQVGKDALIKGIAKGAGKGTAKEAGTEFIQEGMIEYVGEKFGTDAAMSFAESFDRGLAGAVGGGVAGGGIGAVSGAIGSVKGPQTEEEQIEAELLENLEVNETLPPEQMAEINKGADMQTRVNRHIANKQQTVKQEIVETVVNEPITTEQQVAPIAPDTADNAPAGRTEIEPSLQDAIAQANQLESVSADYNLQGGDTIERAQQGSPEPNPQELAEIPQGIESKTLDTDSGNFPPVESYESSTHENPEIEIRQADVHREQPLSDISEPAISETGVDSDIDQDYLAASQPTPELQQITADYGEIVHVAPTSESLPPAIQQDLKRDGIEFDKISGIARNGKIYANPVFIRSKKQLTELVRHELTHNRLSAVLGDQVNGVLDGIATSKNKEIKQVVDFIASKRTYWDQAKAQGMSRKQRSRLFAEEALATMAESTSDAGAFKEILLQIKTRIKKAFGVDVSTEELRFMIRKMRKQNGDSRNGQRYAAIEGNRYRSGDDKRSVNTLVDNSRDQGIANHWDKFAKALQDKQISLKRVTDRAKATGTLTEDSDTYLAETLYYGRAKANIDQFQIQHIDPLLNQIKKSGHSYQAVENYLYARHAKEANAHLQKLNPNRSDNAALSGMSDAEADFYLAKETLALKSIGERIDSITAERRQLMTSSGLESAEAINAWEGAYQHYVPLMRDAASRQGSGKGFSIGGKESKRRTGSSQRASNITGNLVAQYETTLVRAEKNRVANTFMRFAFANPSSMWTVDLQRRKPQIRKSKDSDGNTIETVTYGADPLYKLNDNVLSVKIDGNEHLVSFNEDSPEAMRIVSGLKNLDVVSQNAVTSALTKVNRYLASINTSLNPEFIISNAARDIQTALYNIGGTDAEGMSKQILKNYGPAFKGIQQGMRGKDSKWAQVWHEFEEVGGRTGWLDHYNDVQDRVKKLKSEIELAQGKGLGQGITRAAAKKAHLEQRLDLPAAKIRKGLRSLGDVIELANTTVENSVRLATYKALTDKGVSRQEAARVAKELTVNFNRKGDWGTAMNALYLFYNASIQGSVRLVQAASHSKKVRGLIYATVAASAALDIVNRMLGGLDDDDEPNYDKVPEYVKAHNLVIMLGEGSDYIKIPLPWGYNVFHVLGQSAGQVVNDIYHGRKIKPTEHAGRVASNLVGAFNPIGTSPTFVQSFIPTIGKPAAELGENTNFMGSKIMPDQFPFGAPKPDSQRYFQSVREPSRQIAQWMNEATGGSKHRSGSVDVSPETIDHMLDWATGGVGRFITDAALLPGRVSTEGKEIEPRRVPVTRKVYGKTSKAANAGRYYDRRSQVKQVEAEIKALRQTGSPQAQAAFKERFSVEIQMIRVYKSAEKRLQQIRKSEKPLKEARNKKGLLFYREKKSEVYMKVNKEANRLEHVRDNKRAGG